MFVSRIAKLTFQILQSLLHAILQHLIFWSSLKFCKGQCRSKNWAAFSCSSARLLCSFLALASKSFACFACATICELGKRETSRLSGPIPQCLRRLGMCANPNRTRRSLLEIGMPLIANGMMWTFKLPILNRGQLCVKRAMTIRSYD